MWTLSGSLCSISECDSGAAVPLATPLQELREHPLGCRSALVAAVQLSRAAPAAVHHLWRSLVGWLAELAESQACSAQGSCGSNLASPTRPSRRSGWRCPACSNPASLGDQAMLTARFLQAVSTSRCSKQSIVWCALVAARSSHCLTFSSHQSLEGRGGAGVLEVVVHLQPLDREPSLLPVSS